MCVCFPIIRYQSHGFSYRRIFFLCNLNSCWGGSFYNWSFFFKREITVRACRIKNKRIIESTMWLHVAYFLLGIGKCGIFFWFHGVWSFYCVCLVLAPSYMREHWLISFYSHMDGLWVACAFLWVKCVFIWLQPSEGDMHALG